MLHVACLVSRSSNSFSHLNAQESNFDLAVKWVKVNPGSSFIQTLEYLSSMFHVSSKVSSSSNSFPPLNAQASNFDQGHHLYKLWCACHPCVMLSFKIIGYLVLEKLFEGFYYEHGGHLGQVTRTIYTNTFVLPSYGCST